MDIYSFPLYYISFNRNKNLETHFRDRGFKNINYFQSIDGRKLDIDKLRRDNVISIRSYNDLRTEREQNSGLSSKGAIGCTLSHLALWKECIDKDYPYIIIAEDDVFLPHNISRKYNDKIVDHLQKPNSAVFTSELRKDQGLNRMYGLHFYFISKGACKKLVEHAIPIDVQTDSYITHLADLGEISIDGHDHLAKQKLHASSIQNVCVKCLLPRNVWFYVMISIGTIIVLLLFIWVWKKYKECVNNR